MADGPNLLALQPGAGLPLQAAAGLYPANDSGMGLLHQFAGDVPGLVAARNFQARLAASRDFQRSIGPGGELNNHMLNSYLAQDQAAALAAPEMSAAGLKNRQGELANAHHELTLNLGRQVALSNFLSGLASQKGLTREKVIDAVSRYAVNLGIPMPMIAEATSKVPRDPEKVQPFVLNEAKTLAGSLKAQLEMAPQVSLQNTGGAYNVLVKHPLTGAVNSVGTLNKTLAPTVAQTQGPAGGKQLTQLGGAGAPGAGGSTSDSVLWSPNPAGASQGTALPQGGGFAGAAPGEGGFAASVPPALRGPGSAPGAAPGTAPVVPVAQQPFAPPQGNGAPLGVAALPSGEPTTYENWAKITSQFANDAQVAQQRLATIQQAEAALPKAFTGGATGVRTTLASIGKVFGVNPPAGSLTNTQELNKYLNQLLTQGGGAVPGARDLTDYKLNMVMQANPSVGLTHSAVNNMLGYLQGTERYKLAIAHAWADYKNQFPQYRGQLATPPALYGQFMQEIGDKLNPAAFQFNYLGKKAKAEFIQRLKSDGQYKSFARDWAFAQRYGAQ